MKSLAELEALRNKKLQELSFRKDNDGIRVIVGMATCGIAAGARPVMSSLLDELKKRGISNVSVVMTGCLGICRLEPIVEVINTDGTKVTYVKMDAAKAARVVTEHIVNGKVCTDLTIDAVNN